MRRERDARRKSNNKKSIIITSDRLTHDGEVLITNIRNDLILFCFRRSLEGSRWGENARKLVEFCVWQQHLFQNKRHAKKEPKSIKLPRNKRKTFEKKNEHQRTLTSKRSPELLYKLRSTVSNDRNSHRKNFLCTHIGTSYLTHVDTIQQFARAALLTRA